jgi:hypothetical protein
MDKTMSPYCDCDDARLASVVVSPALQTNVLNLGVRVR